ncbi:hypothetical protein SHEEN_81 [Mycobacterium phage Sheen]|uniref:Uncharacterized protein n=1 Tax=Mycobacterium phage Sheen TaxID=1589274 RepID=A0A0B5A3N8_9CAUD|nr:hypothetical protein AVV31_gp13 [Mycobacterium phage Sheen]AJD82499.1 hypothetical protein SHEEN_81 [Mycobacterium phage Sheen]
MIKSYKGRMITHATEVFVYRNLHRDQWSVRAASGPHKGKVVGHADELVLWGTEFKVSEAGRQRVITEQKKNVHAGVQGFVSEADPDTLTVERRKLSYNPYRSGTFTVNEVPVRVATGVHFDRDGKAWALGAVN